MSEATPYGVSHAKQAASIAAPYIDYRPSRPKQLRRTIAIVGAGGISESHLQAYAACGFNVVAIVDRTLDKAIAMRDRFFPQADALGDYHDVLGRPDIEVVDLTPHPEDRMPILEAAITAGKHILSQKPFVLDLDHGERLVRLADQQHVKLAVNQNGRWAPHFSYMRQAIASGLIGDVASVDFSLQWDQTWIAGIEALENIKHLILFDFGIHWFDITACFMAGQQAEKVWASTTPLRSQAYRPPAMASAIITYPHSQVRIAMNGHTTHGEQDTTTIVGSKGTLRSSGPSLNAQPAVEVFLQEGNCRVELEGCWFDQGFEGTMCELLCAIEEDRQPTNSAANNLVSLELCFAAVASADSGLPIKPGQARAIQP